MKERGRMVVEQEHGRTDGRTRYTQCACIPGFIALPWGPFRYRLEGSMYLFIARVVPGAFPLKGHWMGHFVFGGGSMNR